MLDQAVAAPEPTESEYRRYYEANKSQFVIGQARIEGVALEGVDSPLVQ